MNARSGQRSVAELFGTFAKPLQASCLHSLPGCGLYDHVEALPTAICTPSMGWGCGQENGQTYFTRSVPHEDCPLQLRLFLHPSAGILLEKQASSSFLTDAQRQALDAALADKSPQTGTHPLHCHALPVQRHLLRRCCIEKCISHRKGCRAYVAHLYLWPLRPSTYRPACNTAAA